MLGVHGPHVHAPTSSPTGLRLCWLRGARRAVEEHHVSTRTGPSSVTCQAKGFGTAAGGKAKADASPTAAKLCPCGSGAAYKACCKRYHDGEVAPTPEALMRARFSAYAKGNVSFVVQSTHPTNPLAEGKLPDGTASESSLVEDVRATAEKISWDKLKVLSSEEGSNADEAYVTFQTYFKVKGQQGQRAQGWHTQSFVERSRFLKDSGRWMYVDGVQEWKQP